MKTIQLLTLTLFLSITAFTNAQDASNDATWEETVIFLTEYIENFNSVVTVNGMHNKIYDNWSIINNELILNRKRSYSGDIENEIISAKLKELTDIFIKNNTLYLKFPVNFVNYETSNKNYQRNPEDKSHTIIMEFLKKIDSKNGNEYRFKIEDEPVQRLYKAFQHLNYLAKEKRKKSKF